jgi:hypothetical protein
VEVRGSLAILRDIGVNGIPYNLVYRTRLQYKTILTNKTTFFCIPCGGDFNKRPWSTNLIAYPRQHSRPKIGVISCQRDVKVRI